jgi:hypothetical protein
MLAPDTLHVPLIIKPPADGELSEKGIRVDGVFDLIDVFPTTLGILGLKNSLALSGISRWQQIKNNEPIPAHDSFATGLHQLAQSVCRPPYLFVREKRDVGMQTFHTIVSGAREVCYDITSGEIYRTDLLEAAESLRASLAAKFHTES